MNKDRDYLARRAREEGELARSTADARVAEIHGALARMYAERLADPGAKARLSTQKND